MRGHQVASRSRDGVFHASDGGRIVARDMGRESSSIVDFSSESVKSRNSPGKNRVNRLVFELLAENPDNVAVAPFTRLWRNALARPRPAATVVPWMNRSVS